VLVPRNTGAIHTLTMQRIRSVKIVRDLYILLMYGQLAQVPRVEPGSEPLRFSFTPLLFQ
jgi:hypothetical protein